MSKRFLFCSAVGIAGITSMIDAYAADLPARGVAPRIEYVRVCSVHGEGFFTIPGTDTCMRVSGYARADMRYVEPVNRIQDTVGFRARGRLNIDTRTATGFGKLRAYVRYEFERKTGSFNSLFSDEDDDTLGIPIAGGIEDEADLDVAYIQFGGLTAGLVQSFFDFYTNDLSFEELRGSDQKPALLAYTATFGEGFSATLSFEDALDRRVTGTPFGGFPFPLVPGPNDTPGNGPLAFAGQRIPDIVGNVSAEQSWGDAKISAAVHQIRTVNLVPSIVSPGGDVTDGTFADTKYGFAAQAGVRFDLSGLAEDDEIWFQASYAVGAVDYLNMGEFTQVGGALVNGVDGYVDPTGKVKLSRGFAVLSAFLHHWTPQIRQAVFGGYARLSYPGSAQAQVIDPILGPINTGFVDFDEWRIGTNLTWSPVSGLDFGVELLYTRLNPDGRVASAPIFGASDEFRQRSIDSADVWIGRLRVNREF